MGKETDYGNKRLVNFLLYLSNQRRSRRAKFSRDLFCTTEHEEDWLFAHGKAMNALSDVLITTQGEESYHKFGTFCFPFSLFSIPKMDPSNPSLSKWSRPFPFKNDHTKGNINLIVMMRVQQRFDKGHSECYYTREAIYHACCCVFFVLHPKLKREGKGNPKLKREGKGKTNSSIAKKKNGYTF